MTVKQTDYFIRPHRQPSHCWGICYFIWTITLINCIKFPTKSIIKPIGPIFLLLMDTIVHFSKLWDSSTNVVNTKINIEAGNSNEPRIELLNILAKMKGIMSTKPNTNITPRLFLDLFATKFFRGFSIHLKPNASKVRKKEPIISQMIPIMDKEYWLNIFLT